LLSTKGMGRPTRVTLNSLPDTTWCSPLPSLVKLSIFILYISAFGKPFSFKYFCKMYSQKLQLMYGLFLLLCCI
jgi:hypothetical protein